MRLWCLTRFLPLQAEVAPKAVAAANAVSNRPNVAAYMASGYNGMQLYPTTGPNLAATELH
jgi:hypothetical protein